jgi:hypothetical protein
MRRGQNCPARRNLPRLGAKIDAAGKSPKRLTLDRNKSSEHATASLRNPNFQNELQSNLTRYKICF